MQGILRKKTLRELRAHFLRYLALGLMITLSMYLIVSLIGAADTTITGTEAHAAANRLEDGQFTAFVPLTERELAQLEDFGVQVERMFFHEYALADESVLRVFRLRREIDLAETERGAPPASDGEILLEKRYCEEKGLAPGDTITVAGLRLRVSGIATTPDYEAMLRAMSDSSADCVNFGTAFVTDALYERLARTERSAQAEEYLYAYRLNGSMSDEELRELLEGFDFDPDFVEDPYFRDYWEQNFGRRDDLLKGAKDLAEGNRELGAVLEELEAGLTGDKYPLLSSYLSEETKEDLAELSKAGRELSDGAEELRDVIEELVERYLKAELSKLRSFVPVEDNPRIGAAKDDVLIDKYGSFVAGVIVLALLTYVISVFVIHSIEEEQSIIGALYAMGLRRAELLRHYLLLPVLISALSGAAGTALGYGSFGVPVQMADSYAYFSMPPMRTVVELPAVLYGVVLPPLTAALVNWIVIRRKLSAPALQMLRREEKRRDASRLDLREMSYIRRFRLRQMLREGRSALGVVLGIFVCLLLMMLGVNAYALCVHIGQDNIDDTKYEYMYVYKYPEEEAPRGGTPAYLETLKKEVMGYNLDVTVLGLEQDNPYFEAEPPESQGRVQISSAMAQKYGVRAGETLTLNDERNDRVYAFTVDGVVRYAPGFFVFMDIDCMRELFGASEDYYNAVFADRDLGIDPGRLYSVSTKSDVVKAADVFVKLMYGMVYTMIGASAVIMVIVMYLMMKVMIDRSAQSIALFKIFGYRKRELSSLFLDGNTLLITLGVMASIPLAKLLMDAMYPYLVSNVACAINLHLEPWVYALLFAGCMLCYLLIHALLVLRINRIAPGEVLKNRE